MTNFLKDEETTSDLSALSDTLKTTEGHSDLALREYVHSFASDLGKTNKEHRNVLRKHERVVYGYENETGERTLGLIDRVKELEAWKKKWEENEKRIRYAIAGFAIAGPFIITLLTMIFRTLLAKMGLKT